MADKENVLNRASGRHGWIHPRRIVGAAFLAGTLFGASAMATKKNSEKNMVEKWLDQLG